MITDCLTSADGRLMMMAAHRGSMHKTQEDVEAFTAWFYEHGHVATQGDLHIMARDTITDCLGTLWGPAEPRLWAPFFIMVWERLTPEERALVNRQVAYRDVVGEDKLAWCLKVCPEDTGHGDDDDAGCPGRGHPLEGDIGQRMIVNMHGYCLGRMTYMPEVCRTWLKEWWHYVMPETRYKLLVTTGQALLKGGAGQRCDAESWHAFFTQGRAELDQVGQAALMHDVLYGVENCTASDYDTMLSGDLSKGTFKWTH